MVDTPEVLEDSNVEFELVDAPEELEVVLAEDDETSLVISVVEFELVDASEELEVALDEDDETSLVISVVELPDELVDWDVSSVELFPVMLAANVIGWNGVTVVSGEVDAFELSF